MPDEVIIIIRYTVVASKVKLHNEIVLTNFLRKRVADNDGVSPSFTCRLHGILL